MQRIVILISGRGSNMRQIVQCCGDEAWPAQVCAVLADRPDAGGLEHAISQGIPIVVIDRRGHLTRDAFDAALAAAIDQFEPDLVLLAGFMRILGVAFVQRYAGRLLNIHPSLLPSFAGLHTHRRALQAGCKLAGATVHFVTPELDHGPIIMQSMVPVLATDDEHTLAARVLSTEHVIYPRSVRWFVEGQLRVEGDLVRQVDNADQLLIG